MTLDEAIEHAEWRARESHGECAEEHRQLAEWLRELKRLKSQNKRLRKECTSLRKSREREFAASCEAATNSMGQIGTLRDKNAELRKLATELYSGLVNIGHCLGMFHKCTNHACRNIDIDARCCRLQLALLKAERMGIKAER